MGVYAELRDGIWGYTVGRRLSPKRNESYGYFISTFPGQKWEIAPSASNDSVYCRSRFATETSIHYRNFSDERTTSDSRF